MLIATLDVKVPNKPAWRGILFFLKAIYKKFMISSKRLLSSKEWRKLYHTSTNQKKAGIFISDTF